MHSLASAIAFVERHELLIWLAVSIVVLPLLRKRTPAEWVSLAERKPRTQGLIRLARGAGFDPAKVISGLLQFLTGRVRAAGIADEVSPADAIALVKRDLSNGTPAKPSQR